MIRQPLRRSGQPAGCSGDSVAMFPPFPHQGSETRDYLLGRTFGLGAIAQARIPASTACKAEMIHQLLDAGVLKSFLREAAGAVSGAGLCCFMRGATGERSGRSP